MSKNLSQWVDYIQTIHVREIELSLDRVRGVYQRLYPDGVTFKVIGVAGTNGKGSTAELLASIYRQAGYRVGKYTSPHILRFNERVNINGLEVDDESLINSFERIEQLRGDIKLTFFEYTTLAAIDLFMAAGLDVAIMEVGLGGRLDATNILDTDVAIVTSISIDHTAWLGTDVEQIAAEKIAIAGPDSACVLGMSSPPKSIIDYCQRNDINPKIYNKDFTVSLAEDRQSWDWRVCSNAAQHSSSQSLKAIDKRDVDTPFLFLEHLSLPFAQGSHQLVNAGVAIQAVALLNDKLPVNEVAIKSGVANANTQGRCQLISQQPAIVLDVAHNVASVAGLVDYVKGLAIKGRVYAVCGMLQDKQIVETLSQLLDVVDEWYFATINNERGAASSEISTLVTDHQRLNLDSLETIKYCEYDTVNAAYMAIADKLEEDDCLLVFGSFFVVSDVVALL